MTVRPWDYEWQAELRDAVVDGPFPNGMVSVKRDLLMRLLREHDALNPSNPSKSIQLWMFCEHGRYHQRCCVDCFRREKITANADEVRKLRERVEGLEKWKENHIQYRHGNKTACPYDAGAKR